MLVKKVHHLPETCGKKGLKSLLKPTFLIHSKEVSSVLFIQFYVMFVVCFVTL